MSPDTKAALLLVGIAAAAGLLLYLPFFIWFRVLKRRHRQEIRTELRLTRTGWLVTAAGISFMFAGLAAARLAPQSSLGMLINAVSQWGFLAFMVVAELVVQSVLGRLGLPTVYRKVVLPQSSS